MASIVGKGEDYELAIWYNYIHKREERVKEKNTEIGMGLKKVPESKR